MKRADISHCEGGPGYNIQVCGTAHFPYCDSSEGCYCGVSWLDCEEDGESHQFIMLTNHLIRCARCLEVSGPLTHGQMKHVRDETKHQRKQVLKWRYLKPWMPSKRELDEPLVWPATSSIALTY